MSSVNSVKIASIAGWTSVNLVGPSHGYCCSGLLVKDWPAIGLSAVAKVSKSPT